jgi:hypothetical protein
MSCPTSPVFGRRWTVGNEEDYGFHRGVDRASMRGLTRSGSSGVRGVDLEAALGRTLPGKVNHCLNQSRIEDEIETRTRSTIMVSNGGY